jgi:hypothetical protein
MDVDGDDVWPSVLDLSPDRGEVASLSAHLDVLFAVEQYPKAGAKRLV